MSLIKINILVVKGSKNVNKFKGKFYFYIVYLGISNTNSNKLTYCFYLINCIKLDYFASQTQIYEIYVSGPFHTFSSFFLSTKKKKQGTNWFVTN